jgi:hypothetical protein
MALEPLAFIEGGGEGLGRKADGFVLSGAASRLFANEGSVIH